jgi:hypothetical protein
MLNGGYSLTRGPITSLVTKLVAPYEQGLANGGIQATISLAGVAGPLWAGFVFQDLGMPAPYWTGALAVALAAVAVTLRTRPAPSPAGAPLTAPVPAHRAGEEPAPAVAVAPADSLPEAMLQGSLAGLGLLPVLRLLRSANTHGCLYLSRDGWAGQLWLAGSRLVAVSFGCERGAAALEAILLVLPHARFTFAEGPAVANGELDVDLDEVALHPAIPSPQQRLAAALPPPAAVPRVVRPAEAATGHDPTEVVLRLGTLHTLLEVDGERTIQELSDRRASTRVLLDLAVLQDLGLIQFDVRSAHAVQPVG